jgi:hypothetical protein
MDEKLRANLIIEILGRPVEHVKEAAQTMVTKMAAEQGIKVINKTYHDPILAQDSKTLYTTFTEIEVELDSLDNYFGLLFAYLPSNIEIINPERLQLTNSNLNDLAHKLVTRLHDYDAVTKGAIVERNELTKKLKEVAPHLFKKNDNME